MTDKDILKKVLVIGPDIKAGGGMAEVLKVHRTHIFSNEEFDYLQTNSRRGTIIGAFYLLGLLACIPFKRLKGKKLLHIHASHGKSFYRKLIILYWSKLFGFKSLVQWHGGEAEEFFKKPINRRFLKRMIKNSKGIMVLSNYWKKLFSQYADVETYIIPNIIERRENIQRELHTPLTFLFLGSIVREKGIFEMLEAFKALINHTTEWKLIVCGNGKDEKAMKEFISKNNLQGRVIIAGWVEDNEKREKLEESDVMVLPSYAEAFPVSILEGMSYRLPVIATSVGSIPEMIENFREGILVNPKDSEQLKESIKFYLDNLERVAEHGMNAYEKVASFSPDKLRHSLLDAYRSVLTKNGHGR